MTEAAHRRVAEGLEEMLGVGALLTRSLVTSPGALPWRSQAALIHLALGGVAEDIEPRAAQALH